MTIENFFSNKFNQKDGVYIFNDEDKYTGNFSEQWIDFNHVQVDSFNKTSISRDYLDELTFNGINNLKGKKVLEIGCGAGRFTEYIVKYAKLCVSVDLSKSIFYNVAKDNTNLILIKSDFLELITKDKFDVVICRGVLQHTPNPNKSIVKLFDFINNDGLVFFDYYKKPKIGLFHPKYFFWRPLITSLFTYDSFKIFLQKNISLLINIKKIIRILTFNSNFISDTFVPLWDFRENRYVLNKELFNNWTILDTLDGIFAKYDYPKKNSEIIKVLNENNYLILENDNFKNYFKVQLIKKDI